MNLIELLDFYRQVDEYFTARDVAIVDGDYKKALHDLITLDLAHGEHFHKEEVDLLQKAISELEPRAAFGDQCIQDDYEGALIPQSVVDIQKKHLRDAIANREKQIAELEAELERHATERAEIRGHAARNEDVL